ncbi:hypothetical protein MPLA_2130063 [Mesorhizobium sp. ORS 3359]|nr:hypothetical protein MPLA_2130063 [Mesorhizobium sp. ORS 3359]
MVREIPLSCQSALAVETESGRSAYHGDTGFCGPARAPRWGGAGISQPIEPRLQVGCNFATLRALELIAGRRISRLSKPIDSWQNSYSAPELAAKFGLTVDQARIVISSNPSRHGCEMGAAAFRNALKLGVGRTSRSLRGVTLPKNP